MSDIPNVAPRPAIPSRAAGEAPNQTGPNFAAQVPSAAPPPMFDDDCRTAPLPPGAVGRSGPILGRGEKAAHTRVRNEKLKAVEIKKLKAKRAAALKAKKGKTVKKPTNRQSLRAAKAHLAPGKPKRVRRPVLHAIPDSKPAKNPNRPLEMKNQLAAVLAVVSDLKGAELTFFSEACKSLQDLTHAGRKRVIEALGRVYG